MDETSKEIDIDEIAEKYEEQSFFKRLKTMFSGLKCSKYSREYKLARIELQRLAALLVAVVVPTLVVVVLCVVTMVSTQLYPRIPPVDIPVLENDKVDIVETPEEPISPDDPEPVVIDIVVDAPPSPTVEQPTVAPQPSNPSQVLTTKPAAVDAVSNVKSPVMMKSIRVSRTPGQIGGLTRGGPNGGDPTTEATVLKVLWWLKDQQNTDGSWGKANSVANTSLAVLTYLAHGEYPGSESPYRKDFGPVVQLAIDYLISHLRTDAQPCRFDPTDSNEYSFLLGAYALSEAYGMTQNPNCKDAALQCLYRIVENQSSTGGWDYKLNKNSTRDDLSYAGWAIQALKAGKMAGLHPEGLDQAISKAINCLKKRSYSKSSGFTYTPTSGNNGGATGLAGVGTLAMQLLGRGGEQEVQNALDVMRDWTPSFDPDKLSVKKPGNSPQYYCYYATQCKYQAGMKAGAMKNDEVTWQQWNLAMKKLYTTSIIDLPERVLDWTGKEHKQGYFENKDAHSTRPYMDTCLAALQLMVYYRYLPTTSVKAGAEDPQDGKDEQNAVDSKNDVDVKVDI